MRLSRLVPLAALVMLPAMGADRRPDAKGEGVLFPPVIAPPGVEEPGMLAVPRVIVPLTGEPVNGFPNWSERVIHEWINRARVDPAADLAGCPAGNCPENTGGCYTPQAPLIWNPNAGRSARFHSAEMGLQNFFNHPSNCTLVSNINSLYPGTCDGSASCACVGGTSTCNPTCTDPFARMGLFGVGAAYGRGEIIAAGYSDADSAFYGWLWEDANQTACAYYQNLNPPYDTNGHRWLILKETTAVGTGYASVPGSAYTRYYTGDFGDAPTPIPKIPSGAHYPQQSSSIGFWVNWYDSAPPQSAKVDVDGVCTTMTLGRGSSTNGTYTVNVPGLGSGCHRYYFDFYDSNGVEVSYPSTGSYGIGTAGCADWDVSRPNACAAPAPPTATKFYTLPPCRLVDTRNATGAYGGPILAGGGAPRSFNIPGGACGVPSGAVSVSANVTVTQTGGTGDLRIVPGNLSGGTATTIHFASGLTRANNARIALASNGTGTILVISDGAATHFILDVSGYFQ